MENGSAMVVGILHGDDSITKGSLPWKILAMLANVSFEDKKLSA